jgi:EAL domain-containing protein (putative c-di-GMP-specific phosphodiesterase class I)
MSLKCIVEGVENTAQLEILHGLGCDYIQGYYFARPMSAADTETYIARTQAGQLKTAAKIG